MPPAPRQACQETALFHADQHSAETAYMPSPGTVQLWLLSTAQVGEEDLDTSVLDLGERSRARAFVRTRDRVRYIVAHTAVRRVLGDCLGVPPQDLAFTREPCPCCGGPHGRPALAVASSPLGFSLSHGGDLILIGVAAAPIGVDVESVPGTAAELTTTLHPAEQAELAAVPYRVRAAAFTQLWTRKEAYLKGLGTGLGRDLAADYLGTGGLAAGPSGWTVADLSVPSGHAAAYAVSGPVHSVRLRHLAPLLAVNAAGTSSPAQMD